MRPRIHIPSLETDPQLNREDSSGFGGSFGGSFAEALVLPVSPATKLVHPAVPKSIYSRREVWTRTLGGVGPESFWRGLASQIPRVLRDQGL